VLTSDFLSEIGVVDLADALKLSTNFEENFGDLGGANAINVAFPGANQNLNFQTRGQGGALARNFISTSFRPEFYTIDRIDNSSGPNAILFGIGGAGGVANVSTKRAKLNRNSTSVEFRGDEYGSTRATLDTNYVLVPGKFALRLNAISERGKSFREFSDNNIDGVHLTAKFRLTKRTEINLELERDRRTGLVVDPRPVRDGLGAWLKAGAPTLTVPTNWNSLSTTARNTFLAASATPVGVGAEGTGERWVYVSEGSQSYLVSPRLSLNTVATSANPVTDDSLVPYSVNLSGPGGTKTINRRLAALSIDQKLAESLFFNLSASREYGNARTHQTFFNGTGIGNTYLAGDPNAVLNNGSTVFNPNNVAFTTNGAGQTVNPYAGKQFVEGRWLRRDQEGEQNYAQASLAWQLDFGRWGAHNLVANAGYGDSRGSADEPNLVWRGAPFNNTGGTGAINSAANRVYVRKYITPGDYSTYYAGDWRDVMGLQWQHPTLGLLTPEWVSGTVRANETRDVNGLMALQSFFFKKRLVTTVGLRRDERTIDTFGPVTVKPEPYQKTTGFPQINETSPITQTVFSGNTTTLGAVYHVWKSVSVYYNASNSIAPGNALLYGPDGLPSPQQDGKGSDYGLRFNFGDGKWNIDISRYDTSTINVPSSAGISDRDGTNSVWATWNAIFDTLNAPANGPQLFNTGSQAALDDLKARYSELRPVWVAQGDIYDNKSSGYEFRLTANPVKGLRLRLTYGNTDAMKENLLKNTRLAREQLGEFLVDLQAKNSGVNVLGLTRGGPSDLTVSGYRDLMDVLIEQIIDLNSNAFGSAKHRVNFNVGYDLSGRFRGWSVGTGVNYRSASVAGSYQIIDPAQPRVIIQEIPIYGRSLTDWSANLRYNTRHKLFGRDTLMTFQLNATNLFRSSAELLPRRYDTIVVAPGAALPGPGAPTSSFILAPRTISASLKLSF
jgi:iron complex outermembrane recepter protein